MTRRKIQADWGIGIKHCPACGRLNHLKSDACENGRCNYTFTRLPRRSKSTSQVFASNAGNTSVMTRPPLRSKSTRWIFVALVPVAALIIVTAIGIATSSLHAPVTAQSNLADRVEDLETGIQILEEQIRLLNNRIFEIESLSHVHTKENHIVTPEPLSTLSPLPTLTPPPTTETTKTVPEINTVLVVHVERGNVRSGPGTGYNILATVHEGHVIRGPFDKKDGWYQFCCVDDQPAWLSSTLVAEHTVTSSTVITTPPTSLDSHQYYQKHLNAGGVPILAAKSVNDEVLFRTQDTITAMLQNRPDLLHTMSIRNFRVGIYDFKKGDITQLPEVDSRFRNKLGIFTATLNGSIIGVPNSVQHCNRVLIHEVAHAIYSAITRRPGGDRFKDRWGNAYREAMAAGLWIDHYASTNESEYWAETVTYWFMPKVFKNTFGIPFPQYDPTANQLISGIFGHTKLPDFCEYGFMDIAGTISHADGTPIEGIYVVPVLWLKLDGKTRHIGTASARQNPVSTNQDGEFVIRQAIDKGVLESRAYFMLGFYQEPDPTRPSTCLISGWLHHNRYISKSWGSAIISVKKKNAEFSITVRQDFDWSSLQLCNS